MTPAAVPIRLAATVVLLRDGPGGPEVLLTRRPSSMAFGPGLHVFPGGALEPGDDDPGLLGRLRTTGSEPATHAGAVMIAAIRELYEEAGVLLATRPADGASGTLPMGEGPDSGVAIQAPAEATPADAFPAAVHRAALELRGDWLVPLSRWVTPPTFQRRFDARFFVARLPAGAVPVLDPAEVADHTWLTPRDALAAMADGRIALWPPTATTLQQLRAARGIDDVRRYLAPLPGAGMEASPLTDQPAPSVTRLRLNGAGAIAGQTVNTFLVGHRRVAIVDPGDPGDAAIGRLLQAVEDLGATPAVVLLTAPVPDHAAGVEALVRRLGVRVRASAGARHLLASEVMPLVDGERVDEADIEIRVHATPGTHPDHLAFEVPAADAVLVGDLEGPGPSRTIPEPVDPRELARSRRKVSALGRSHRLAAHDQRPGERDPANATRRTRPGERDPANATRRTPPSAMTCSAPAGHAGRRPASRASRPWR